MNVELKEVTVRELTDGYKDNAEDGIFGYSGNLDIRPPYQREFIYEPKQRDAVIHTVNQNFPLNVMYWAVRQDGGFEIIDGQQRTISLCQYVNGDFSFEGRYFDNLQTDEKESLLNYKLMIYRCSGTDSERLAWFRTINIAGKELTDQELRNAVYSGSWVTDAKRYFSKTGCPAYAIGGKYLSGTANRQEYLETIIDWINAGKIEEYMGKQQHKPNANDLWLYFQSIMSWVKATFPEYRREMKGIEWGVLYNTHGKKELDPVALEVEVSRLMADDDVTKKKGIYSYVLDGEERTLNIRTFTDNQKREAYEVQHGICPKCKNHFELNEMEADHATPWHEGGKTNAANCQMLCKDDNRRKSGKWLYLNPGRKSAMATTNKTSRHSIRPDDAKLRELILLIAGWCQADPKFGAIKLNKLLFHADFCAFLTHAEPITGQEYFKLEQGPAPRRLKPITEAMIRKGEFAWQEVPYYGRTQKKPVALRAADLSKFSGPEVALIRQTVEKFWKMNATEISDQSHIFLGWKAAHLKETIPYSTALVSRRPPTDHERMRGLRLQGLAEQHLSAHR